MPFLVCDPMELFYVRKTTHGPITLHGMGLTKQPTRSIWACQAGHGKRVLKGPEVYAADDTEKTNSIEDYHSCGQHPSDLMNVLRYHLDSAPKGRPRSRTIEPSNALIGWCEYFDRPGRDDDKSTEAHAGGAKGKETSPYGTGTPRPPTISKRVTNSIWIWADTVPTIALPGLPEVKL